MSRYRKVTPISLEEQERIMKLRRTNPRPIREPRQFRTAPLPRPPISYFFEKLLSNRSTDSRNVREIVTSTCFNLRGACQYIRSFADDMENLLNSVESIAPVVEGVVAGYTRSLKSKENPAPEKKEVPKEMKSEEINEPPKAQIIPEPEPAKSQNAPPPFSDKMPTEEELKEFLNNPLVTTLMQVMAKNLAAKR